MVEAGSFRADLYYRLNVIPLALPPLREHGKRLPNWPNILPACTPGACSARLGTSFCPPRSPAWPGNVRELANLMRRAVALSEARSAATDDGENEGNEAGAFCGWCGSAWVGLEAFEFAWRHLPPRSAGPLRPGMSLDEMERRLFDMTLDATGGNRSRAAEMLGVSLRTVRNKIRGYGLPPRAGERESYAHDHVPDRFRADQALGRFLDLTVFRQALITSNLANIDTPGYRTRDVNFRQELERAAGGCEI